MPRVRTAKHNYKPLKNVGINITSDESLAVKLSESESDTQFEYEPAEVVDVILDETHVDYVTPDDIGKARVRLLYSEKDLAYLPSE